MSYKARIIIIYLVGHCSFNLCGQTTHTSNWETEVQLNTEKRRMELIKRANAPGKSVVVNEVSPWKLASELASRLKNQKSGGVVLYEGSKKRIKAIPDPVDNSGVPSGFNNSISLSREVRKFSKEMKLPSDKLQMAKAIKENSDFSVMFLPGGSVSIIDKTLETDSLWPLNKRLSDITPSLPENATASQVEEFLVENCQMMPKTLGELNETIASQIVWPASKSHPNSTVRDLLVSELIAINHHEKQNYSFHIMPSADISKPDKLRWSVIIFR